MEEANQIKTEKINTSSERKKKAFFALQANTSEISTLDRDSNTYRAHMVLCKDIYILVRLYPKNRQHLLCED